MALATPSYPWTASLALPFTRLEVPGWGRLFGLFKIEGKYDKLWKNAPSKLIRGKYHGYWMDLNLSNWSERYSYFLGRFYDLPTQQVMKAAIQPGDRVVDVGANIGMITLLAARLVGENGHVDAFEPNPKCAARITALLARNDIRNVDLHPCGLGDLPGQFTLSLASEHTGTGTLATVLERDRDTLVAEIPVKVEVGDEILLHGEKPVDFIKIDVEGFEYRALLGLRGVLERWRPLIVTEVLGQLLERAGSSEAELLDLMEELGYEGFEMMSVRRKLKPSVALKRRHRDIATDVDDVLWVHPKSRARDRVQSLIIG